MGYSQEHIEKTKNRIIDRAGKMFRSAGYNGVGIDKIMNAAGLTRGGFYAHFRSKAHLFEAVIADDFDFTRQLRRLSRDQSEKTANRALFAIQHYLGTDTRDHVGSACTMASSAIDVSGAGRETKAAFENRLADLISELKILFQKDGVEKTDADLRSLISMCVGGLILSRACNDDMAAQILGACKSSIEKTTGHE